MAGSESPRGGPSGPGRFVRPFLEEPGLRIVLFAGVGILVTFGAWLAANAIRSRSVTALGALLLLGWASAEGVRAELRAGGLGALSGLIAAVWLLTALGASVALRFGLF